MSTAASAFQAAVAETATKLRPLMGIGSMCPFQRNKRFTHKKAHFWSLQLGTVICCRNPWPSSVMSHKYSLHDVAVGVLLDKFSLDLRQCSSCGAVSLDVPMSAAFSEVSMPRGHGHSLVLLKVKKKKSIWMFLKLPENRWHHLGRFNSKLSTCFKQMCSWHSPVPLEKFSGWLIICMKRAFAFCVSLCR